MTGEIKSHYEVVVIGAGVAGIYQIKRLADLGVDAMVLEAAPTSAAPGTGTATPAPASTPRATPTATPSRRSCSTSGTGRSASPASRRTCATSTTSPTSSTCASTCSSTARSSGASSTRRSHLAAQARRRPRADLPLRHSRGRPAVGADAAAAARAWTPSRAARSTPSTGRTSRSTWPARGSASSAPAPPASRSSARSPTRSASSPCSSAGRTGARRSTTARSPKPEMADIRARYDEIFAACARTPGGFEHEPDRRGFYEVTPRGAAGAVGQALRRARLRHLAEQLPRDLHRRGGQRRVLRVHRRPHPPAGQRPGDGREADPEGPRLRRAARAAGDPLLRGLQPRQRAPRRHQRDADRAGHRDRPAHHRARLRVRHHRLRHRLRRHHRRVRPDRHPRRRRR